jgi:hypothetical protein
MVHACVFCHSSHKIHFSSCNSAFVFFAFIVQHSLTYVDKAITFCVKFSSIFTHVMFDCSKCYIDQKLLSNLKTFLCVIWMTYVEWKHKRYHVSSLKPLTRLKEIWYCWPTVETVMNWSLRTVTPSLWNPERFWDMMPWLMDQFRRTHCLHILRSNGSSRLLPKVGNDLHDYSESPT